jgi:signal transduction histidine kinase
MDDRKVLNIITLENFSRVKYLSLILVCYSLFILFIDFGPIKVWPEDSIVLFRILDVAYALVSLATVLFSWFYRKNNLRVKNIVNKLVLFFLLTWAGIVSGIELTNLGFSTLVVVVLISVFFVYNNLITSTVFFSGAFLTFVCTVALRGGFNESFIPALTILLPIILVSIFISKKNYVSKVNELINTEKLRELNHELNAIKENLENIVEQRTIELYSAKEKAEQSDRLKSAFLANMSHEIRTPMNGILGFAELLKEPNLSGEDQINYITMIEEGGERMLSIINNLMDISKIEAGMTKIFLSETNINAQLEYIYTFFRPEVEKKGIRLVLKTSLNKNEALIITDREKIYAILTNLVKNAIKYSKSGSIELGCDVKIENTIHENSSSVSDKQNPNTGLVFYVKDSGIGIPNDRQDAIFERFIQADIEDARAYQGAGLGLAISKAYVEMLGGKMWVESELQKGSIFYFTIPNTTNY